MMDPTIGRWLEEDPDGFAAGDADLYRYVGNNPTNATDPTGLDEEKITGNKYGDWKITQTNKFDFAAPYESQVSIVFTPNKHTVDASEIAFVQIGRIYSLTDKTWMGSGFLAGKTAFRQAKNGWAVDRVPHKYGWYGYGDDGKPMGKTAAGIKGDELVIPVLPGSCPKSYTPAEMKDVPASNVGTINLQWEFEIYAIAKSGKDKGKVYGGISWGFDVDDNARVTSRKRRFLKAPTPEFQAAVGLWDKQAKDPNKDHRTTEDQQAFGTDITFP